MPPGESPVVPRIIPVGNFPPKPIRNLFDGVYEALVLVWRGFEESILYEECCD